MRLDFDKLIAYTWVVLRLTMAMPNCPLGSGSPRFNQLNIKKIDWEQPENL